MRTLGAVVVVVAALAGHPRSPAAHPRSLVTTVGTQTACYPVMIDGVLTPGLCQEVDVTCERIGPRRATILTRRPPVQTRGNVILFTGELSTQRYSKHPVRRERIVEPLLDDGFATFEVFYETPSYEIDGIPGNPNPDLSLVPDGSPTDGIFHGVDGEGIDYTCSADVLMRHIVDHLAVVNTADMCAAGNSGGGEQIAGALTLYNAEEYLASAVISAGPPMVQFYEACAGTEGVNVPYSMRDHVTERMSEHEPFGAPSGGFSPRELIDRMTGTYDATKYLAPGRNVCARDLVPNHHQEEVLRSKSLVLSDDVKADNHLPRDYTYMTFVDFVSPAEDASGAGPSPFGRRQGNYYYDLVALNNPHNAALTVIGVPGNNHPPTPAQIAGDVHTLDSLLLDPGGTPGADAILQKLRLRCAR